MLQSTTINITSLLLEHSWRNPSQNPVQLYICQKQVEGSECMSAKSVRDSLRLWETSTQRAAELYN